MLTLYQKIACIIGFSAIFLVASSNILVNYEQSIQAKPGKDNPGKAQGKDKPSKGQDNLVKGREKIRMTMFESTSQKMSQKMSQIRYRLKRTFTRVLLLILTAITLVKALILLQRVILDALQIQEKLSKI